MQSEKIEKQGDTLTSTPTVCLGCYNSCGVKVQSVNGKVVDVIGDKETAKLLAIRYRDNESELEKAYSDWSEVSDEIERAEKKLGA